MSLFAFSTVFSSTNAEASKLNNVNKTKGKNYKTKFLENKDTYQRVKFTNTDTGEVNI
jgi:hypothetical protein